VLALGSHTTRGLAYTKASLGHHPEFTALSVAIGASFPAQRDAVVSERRASVAL
jgi:hypothetical protein